MFAKSDEPSAFADEILDLLYDEEKQRDYSDRGRELARKFSWDSVANKFLKALDD